jgi:predicted type IV restriction endonuclease
MEASGRQALSATVDNVRARIVQIRERAESIGEQDTKAMLIEPVLAALGWHPDELDEVEWNRPDDCEAHGGRFARRRLL